MKEERMEPKPFIVPNGDGLKLAVAWQVVVDQRMVWMPPLSTPFWMDTKERLTKEEINSLPDLPYRPGVYKWESNE